MADEVLTLDINDPSAVLPDEPIEHDPNEDYFGFGPPVDDGEYVARLTLSTSRKSESGKGKDGKTWFRVPVQLKIVGGKFENRVVFHDVWERDAKGILHQALEVPVPGTLKGLVKQLFNSLAGEPLVTIKTQLEARCSDCAKQAKLAGVRYKSVRGQRKFPEGMYILECPECGTAIEGRPRVVRFGPAKSQGPAKAAAAAATVNEDIPF